jgi:hypothetical protein
MGSEFLLVSNVHAQGVACETAVAKAARGGSPCLLLMAASCLRRLQAELSAAARHSFGREPALEFGTLPVVFCNAGLCQSPIQRFRNISDQISRDSARS